MKKQILKIFLLTAFFLFTGILKVHAAEIPLTVAEKAGISRVQEPVATGIPFALSDNVFSVDNFGVFDGEVEIPAQFTVTSRWHGTPKDNSKSIRWVLVEFQATVASNITKEYILKTSGGSGSAGSGISVVENFDNIIINTTEAEFTLNKLSWNIFDKVMIKNSQDGGNLTRQVVSSDSSVGASILQSDNGTRYFAKNNVQYMEIESQGPLHAVVLLKGKFRDNNSTDLFDWKARIHFYKDKSYAKMDFSFIDKDTLSSITQFVNLDDISLDLKLAKVDDTNYIIAGDGSNIHSGSLSETQTASILQIGSIDQGSPGATSDEGTANSISYTLGGQASGSGIHSRGWVDLSDSMKGVTVAMKYFWQLYPKKMEVSNDGNIGIHLWPNEVTDMRMYSASQKTHELLFYFHDSSSTVEDKKILVESLFGIDTSYDLGSAKSSHFNLFPVAPVAQYVNSKAIGYVGTSDVNAYALENRSLVSKYYNYANGLLDRSLRERNSGGTRGGGHEYMMWSFGDSRDASWSNMAYDTSRADALLFAATGDRRFLDHMEEVTQHFRDVDVEHSILNTRGGTTSLTAKWLGRTKYNPSDGGEHDLGYAGRTQYGFEHYKGQGLADHYFLKGDLLSKDILMETYHYAKTWKALSIYNDDADVRIGSKPLGPILGAYQVTGDESVKADAEFVIDFLNNWQDKNDPDGVDPNHWMWNGESPKTGQSSAQVGLTSNFMLDYMNDVPSAQDQTSRIVNACKFITDPANEYWTGSYFNDWRNNNYGLTHATVIDFMAIGGLSFCSKASGIDFNSISKIALDNGIEQDTANGNLKPYTQKTRYVPTSLYFLQENIQMPNIDQVSPSAPSGFSVD